MRKSVLYLFAALLVVALPLSAMAGTQVYQFKDQPYWNFICYDKFHPYNPGPAAEFGTDLNPTVCVEYIGMSHETVRVKTNKDGTTDVGWNRQIQGTAVAYSTGGPVAFARTMAEGITGLKAQKPAQSGDILFQGNFQVEEVIQDDGNDAGCLRGDNSADLESCMWTGVNWWNLDYIMYHWKINGNSIYFWKTTVKNGEFCQEDTRAPEGRQCVAVE